MCIDGVKKVLLAYTSIFSSFHCLIGKTLSKMMLIPFNLKPKHCICWVSRTYRDTKHKGGF